MLPTGVEVFRLGGRHDRAAQLAAELAAADGAEPIAFLVAEFRDGAWLLGDEWTSRFDDLREARAYAARVRFPYRVGVLAVVPIDAGRLYPARASC